MLIYAHTYRFYFFCQLIFGQFGNKITFKTAFMSLLDNILLALNAIRGNLLRAILTATIIAFGIMALVGILTAVDGIKASLNSNFATMGANNFDIRQKGTGFNVGRRGLRAENYPPISISQALEFKDRFDYPATVSVSFFADGGSTVKYQSEKTNPNISVRAGDENYLPISGIELGNGRNFSEAEARSGRSVALIGEGIARDLFNTPERAMDKVVSVNNRPYLVIGVMTAKGSTGLFSPDDMVLIPLQNARAVYANNQTTYVTTVKVDGAYEIDMAIAESSGLMRSVRRLKLNEEEDFAVSKSDKLSTILIEQSSYITTAATVIGFITLLGGAIGLMNIMLVSVAERIREIGICKALGATRRTILTQFLVEAVVICQFGGIFGIILGIMAGNGVSLLIKGPFIIPWGWIAGGIAICFVVGLTSGLYPAIRAADVDPIESLRHE